MKKSLIALALLAASCAVGASVPCTNGGGSGGFVVDATSYVAGITKMAPGLAKKAVKSLDAITVRAKIVFVRGFGMEKPTQLPKAKKSGQFTQGGEYLPGAHDVPEISDRLAV